MCNLYGLLFVFDILVINKDDGFCYIIVCKDDIF